MAQEEASGLATVINNINLLKKEITNQKKQHTADLADLRKELSEKIDSLFVRIAMLVMATQLAIIGGEKVIKGIIKYYIVQQQITIHDETNTLLKQTIGLLSFPEAHKILEEARLAREGRKAKPPMPGKLKAGLFFLAVLVVIAIVKTLTRVV